MALLETELLQGATVDTIELVNPDTQCWHFIIDTAWGTRLDDYWMDTARFREWLVTFLDEEVVDGFLNNGEA